MNGPQKSVGYFFTAAIVAVIPAKAGIQWLVRLPRDRWIPAGAGMTRKKYPTLFLGVAIVLLVVAGGLSAQDETPAVRFAAVDVIVDSPDQPLAAYQLDFHATSGNVSIVGIEGGEHEAYRNPPYYDPQAMQQQRVIIAAFNTGDDLPTGKTRIATIHLQITGDTKPQYKAELVVAATTGGKSIDADIALEGSK